jgi:hypothetical protein
MDNTNPDGIKTAHIIGNYWDDGSPMQDTISGVGMSKLPSYYDINGQEHLNYAYNYGPHSGKTCLCPECSEFNKEFSNRIEQTKLLNKVKNDAENFFLQCSSSASFRHVDVRIDLDTAMQIMVHFAKKQIAEYQAEMVKKVHEIQISHTAAMYKIKEAVTANVISHRKNERQKVKSVGRLFRVEGEHEEKA